METSLKSRPKLIAAFALFALWGALAPCAAWSQTKPLVVHRSPSAPIAEPSRPAGYGTYIAEAVPTAYYHLDRWVNGPYSDTYDNIILYGQYDPGYGYARLAEHIDDADLEAAALIALDDWRDDYSVFNSGSVRGYYNYTDGLRRDWTENGDATSRDALIDQAVSAKFAAGGNMSGEYDIRDEVRSREIAYAVEGYINAEVYAAQSHNARLLPYILLMLGDVDEDVTIGTSSPSTANLDDGGYIEQWLGTYTTDANGDYVSGTTEFVSTNFAPFMGALTIHALARYYDEAASINGGITPDARTVDKIVRLLDAMWNEAHGTANNAPDNDSFYYRPDDYDGDSILNEVDADDSSGETYATINMIAYGYWWAYKQTGDIRHLTRGDAAFLASLNLDSLVYRGVATQPYLSKEVQQSLRWTIDGFDVRAEGVALHGE